MTKLQAVKKVPNPEVKEPGVRARRRNHTAEYKMRILKEADLCKGESGAISALLRREGLYSSFLTECRKQRDNGTLAAFSKKRGVKTKYSPKDREMDRLRAENRKLEERLRQANLIIEVQKKISAILGIPPAPETEERMP